VRLALVALLFVGCAHTTQRSSEITEVGAPSTFHQEGKASFYGKEHQGGPTASGERFDMHKLTAAHRTLPMQTRVRVTSKLDGRSVEVRINDRGPYGGHGRIIDLSYAAAKLLGMLDAGVIPVVIDALR
jgi:rare lipoprotein A